MTNTTRPLVALLLVFASAALGADGPRASSGSLVVDARAYATLQDAVDALGGKPHLVRLPAQDKPYGDGEPLWLDKDGVALVGDGAGLSQITGTILTGLRRIPLAPGTTKPQALDKSYLFNAGSLLDG